MLTQKIPYAIRIFHTNDIHSRVQSNDYNQGLELEFHPVFLCGNKILISFVFYRGCFSFGVLRGRPFPYTDKDSWYTGRKGEAA